MDMLEVSLKVFLCYSVCNVSVKDDQTEKVKVMSNSSMRRDHVRMKMREELRQHAKQ